MSTALMYIEEIISSVLMLSSFFKALSLLLCLACSWLLGFVCYFIVGKIPSLWF
jgi:hypothetical protein